jgi:hypothetical protein
MPSDLRDRVANRVNNPATDCGQFIKKVLDEAARIKGKKKGFYDDPLAIFDRVQKQGGFHLASQGNWDGLSTFTVGGTRIVYIKQTSQPDDPRLINHSQNYYANIALNEIMHQAAEGNGLYSHGTLDTALFNVMSPAERAAHPLPTTSDDEVKGRYFHSFITGRCPPS